MCIIIYEKAGGQLTEEQIRSLWKRNSDGFGIIPLAEGAERVPEKVGKPSKVEDILEVWDKYHTRPYIAHMRLKTHGEIDEDNCHPYEMAPQKWLFHNGVLTVTHQDDKKRSDTWHFIEYVLKPLGDKIYECLEDPNFLKVFGKMIGDSNKLGFVLPEKVVLVNEDRGKWFDNSMWLSNTISLETTKSNPLSYYSGGLPWGKIEKESKKDLTFSGIAFTKEDIAGMNSFEIAANLRMMPKTFLAAVKEFYNIDVSPPHNAAELKKAALQIFGNAFDRRAA